MEIVAFEPSHLIGLRIHAQEARYQRVIDEGLITSGWTVIGDDGIVAIGGLGEIEDGTAAWLMFTDKMTARYLLPVYRACRRVVDAFTLDSERLLFDMDLEDAAIRRWARLMKMRPLGPVSIDGRTLTRMTN